MTKKFQVPLHVLGLKTTSITLAFLIVSTCVELSHLVPQIFLRHKVSCFLSTENITPSVLFLLLLLFLFVAHVAGVVAGEESGVPKDCCVSAGVSNASAGFFKPSGNEDGRFQISDIHENGYGFNADDEDDYDYDENDVRLKRSHSTGDLCVRRSGRGFSRSISRTGDEPR